MSTLRGSAQLLPPAARLDSWGLLNSTTTIENLLNGTTARTLTRSNLTIQVSFVSADPPHLSYFCVHCLNSDKKNPFASTPTVVCSVEDTALIRAELTTEEWPRYFLYRARGPYGRPSLDLLPEIRDYYPTDCLLGPPLAFVSHDNRKQFVVAALTVSFGAGALPSARYYNLHTIGSEPHSTWSKKLLKVEIPDGLTAKSAVIVPTKVIALGGGLFGWVDLRKGILICDVLSPAATTTARFVPMPKLLPSNNEIYWDSYSAQPIRDVTFSRGYIRCVELEQLVQLRATPVPDPWDMPELHDSVLAISPPQEEVYDVVGWRLITWYRALDWDCWRRGNMVRSDDLVGTVSLPQLGGGALNVPVKNLKTASPTLRGDDDDVVYLMSMLQEDDQDAWIVTLDTNRKSVGEVMLSPAKEPSIYDPTFIPCVLSKYLLDAKADGAREGKRNASHVPPSQNLSKSKKQRQQLPQAELEEQQPEPQLLQHSSRSR